MARALAETSGKGENERGLVLRYHKPSRFWVPMTDDGSFVTIADTGFSEAAAERFYASMVGLFLFCYFPKKGLQTLILSLAIAGCNDGNLSDFLTVTEEA